LSSCVNLKLEAAWERGRPARTGLDQGSGKVPLTKGDSGFAETAQGLSCPRFTKPGQPPRPAAFAPFVKGDFLAGRRVQGSRLSENGLYGSTPCKYLPV
jgi:hypothetical protein